MLSCDRERMKDDCRRKCELQGDRMHESSMLSNEGETPHSVKEVENS